MTKEEKNKAYQKEYQKEYQKANKEKAKTYGKIYHKENKEKIKAYYKNYYEANKEKSKTYGKIYYKSNKKMINEKEKEKMKTDPLFKLANNMRSMVYQSLKNAGFTKKSRTYQILCCSFEEFLTHLNDNPYGFTHGDKDIDVDHIIPLAFATTEEEVIKLNHYTNLQLLPSFYNQHIKSDKPFDKKEFEEWLSENENVNKKINILETQVVNIFK